MINIVEGNKISKKQITDFNSAWKLAFGKDKDILHSSSINPRDIHFFLYDESELVAIGRYRFVTGIKIGEVEYTEEIWGRADIGVCGLRGEGYGKEIVSLMTKYAFENKMASCIGFHGKKGKLSEFYRKCGLVVDENIGERFIFYRDGELADMGHTNISYFKGDPFIEAVKVRNDKVTIPLSW